MNTAGHGRIAQEVGLPMLVDALAQRGFTNVPLNAFPLGNWLTDVQQLVDPVAGAVLQKQLVESSQAVVDQLLRGIYLGQVPSGNDPAAAPSRLRRLQDQLRVPVDELQATLEQAIGYLFASDAEPADPRRTRSFDTFRSTFQAIGYFTFVDPQVGRPRLAHEAADGPRMSSEGFFAVFKGLFTQYYPHDHLDRPEVPGTDPVQYRDDIAAGPATRDDAPWPDLYDYLREDIHIAAGRLTQVERDLGQELFDLGEAPRVEDPDWHVSLALLGRAMHAVEDFYAHSNFVEHALSVLGAEAYPSSPAVVAATSLRLQRLVPPHEQELDSRRPTELGEDHVVTGFFDKVDTFHSVSHLGLELFDARLVEPDFDIRAHLAELEHASRQAGAAVTEARALLYEVSEILSDPQAALDDPTNATAKRLQAGIPLPGDELSPEVVRRLLQGSPLYDNAPERIQENLVDALIGLHTGVAIGRAGMTLYRALRTVVRFVHNPVRAVADRLKGWIEPIIKQVKWFYVIDRLETLLGAKRIGCHTLLAKDDEAAPLHALGWNCAAGVHHYVLSVFTRHHPELAPSRPPASRSTDWLELLEFFLRHPRTPDLPTPVTTPRCVTRDHVVDNVRQIDSLATLASRYASTSCRGVHEPAPPPLTWKTIADANFGTEELTPEQTQYVVNGFLARTGTGYPVADGINYAFVPGTVVRIPHQHENARVQAKPPPVRTWWAEIIARLSEPDFLFGTSREDRHYGAWTVVRGHEEPVAGLSRLPIDTGHRIRLIRSEDADRRIADADAIRQHREAAYVP